MKTSIVHFGLIQQIVVIQTGDRFKLVVGQRRYFAFKDAGKRTIPALIIKPMSLTAQRIVSFGENIHRKKLPYDDTIKVCEELYKQTSGTKFQRIEKIAKELGISPGSVSRYLSYKLVPNEVQKLVNAEKLSPKLAYRITTAFWPNTAKITKIANYATRLTKSELERALDIGTKSPNAQPEEIVEEAKKAPPSIEIVITVERESLHRLQQIAEQRKMDVPTLVKGVIEDFLEEEAS